MGRVGETSIAAMRYNANGAGRCRIHGAVVPGGQWGATVQVGVGFL